MSWSECATAFSAACQRHMMVQYCCGSGSTNIFNSQFNFHNHHNHHYHNSVVVVVVDPTPPTCCQQSPAPEIMWQPAVSPPRWQGKAPLCRDSSRGPG